MERAGYPRRHAAPQPRTRRSCTTPNRGGYWSVARPVAGEFIIVSSDQAGFGRILTQQRLNSIRDVAGQGVLEIGCGDGRRHCTQVPTIRVFLRFNAIQDSKHIHHPSARTVSTRHQSDCIG